MEGLVVLVILIVLWYVLKGAHNAPRVPRRGSRRRASSLPPRIPRSPSRSGSASLPREGYGPHWKDLSRRTRQRDNWTCQQCGWRAVGRNRRFLHAHHIVPRGQGGADILANLTSLCLECHAQQPGHAQLRAQSTYQGFQRVRRHSWGANRRV